MTEEGRVEEVKTTENPHITNQIYFQQPQTNGFGKAGFVLALIGLIFSWVPVLGWVSGLLGAIFSIIGLFKEPRGLAIAGTVISFIGLIVFILLFTVLAGVSLFV